MLTVNKVFLLMQQRTKVLPLYDVSMWLLHKEFSMVFIELYNTGGDNAWVFNRFGRVNAMKFEISLPYWPWPSQTPKMLVS